MDSQTRVCQNCKQNFAIESEDFAFYERMKVPAPTFCPQCRFVRRLVMRNERALYKRKCDLCGQEKIAIYKPNSPFKVYCFQCWWSDKWDASEYAQEYDLNKPFFEQWWELFLKVPRMGVIQQGFIVDSEYTNRVSDLKNCYLIFASANDENCFYGTSFWDTKDSMDCYNVRKSEKCYECIDVFNCNNLRYSKECTACSNSAFLLNCRNLESCFGCVNLRNKNYCIFNEQYSKEDYQAKIKQYDLGNSLVVSEIKKRMAELAGKFIVPALVEYKSTDVSGNWIEQSKNLRSGWDCELVENGKYLMGVMESKDMMDLTYWGKGSELIYYSTSVGRECANVKFSNESWDQLFRAEYCMNCHSSSDLFGCVGMRKKQYCILNKQYSKEEYEAMAEKVKEHMGRMPYADKLGRTYKYGEYFPVDLTAFAYNETIAQDLMPTDKEKALAQGYRWEEPESRSYSVSLKSEDLPFSIAGADDSILQKVIGCAHGGNCNDQCATAFRLTPFELSYYRSMSIPLPRLCPNCRHRERLRQRSPMLLWSRSCECEGSGSRGGVHQNTAVHFHGQGHCPNKFETSYALDRPEPVYCLECYNAEIA